MHHGGLGGFASLRWRLFATPPNDPFDLEVADGFKGKALSFAFFSDL